MKPGDLANEGTAIPSPLLGALCTCARLRESYDGHRPDCPQYVADGPPRGLGPIPPELFERAIDIPSSPDPVDQILGGTVLALDLGTNTGWAMRPLASAQIVSGVVKFAPSRFEGGGMRFLRFKQWLTEMKTAGVAVVYFEEVVFHGKFNSVGAAHLYGGMLAILTAWCEHHGIPYRGVPVSTIKKSFAGKGNANKEAMLAHARALGYQPEDDNEADAIAILLFVEESMRSARAKVGKDPF